MPMKYYWVKKADYKSACRECTLWFVVCVSVCVCVREKEKEREIDSGLY